MPKGKLAGICLLCATMLAAPIHGAKAAAISAGMNHSMFIGDDGSLWATGWNVFGQLGAGDLNHTLSPLLIVTNNVTAVSAGRTHTLFLKSDGSLWGMGQNAGGQLGDGTTNDAHLPELIISGPVTKIASGYNHSLFVKSDGSLWGMGTNTSGQLGDGSTMNTNRPEFIMAGPVTAICGGGAHSLFVKKDGSLWGMGQNTSGQLGDGTFQNTNLPEQILPGNVTAVAAGNAHSLFLKSDGSLWGMGLNVAGQLGPGRFTTTNQPVLIVASGVTAIAAGANHSLFVKSDGSFWDLGENSEGQLGIGRISNSTNQPQLIVASNVTAAAGAFYHSLLLKSDGGVWGMGLNSFGQIGGGNTGGSLTPRLILQFVPCELYTVNTLVAGLDNPNALVMDAANNLFVADSGDNVIRELRFSGTNWMTNAVIGCGIAGLMDGPGASSMFSSPNGIAMDAGGTLYVTDSGNGAVRKIAPQGGAWVVTTLVTNLTADGLGGLEVDSAINIFFAEPGRCTVRELSLVNGVWTVTDVVGLANTSGSQDGTNDGARFYLPEGVAVDASGTLYVGDSGNNKIRKMVLMGTNWVVTTLAGGVQGAMDGPNSQARFDQPEGVAVDTFGNVYIGDTGNATIRKINPAGWVTTLAGFAGSPGTQDGIGNAARFTTPNGIAVDSHGIIYVADGASIRMGQPLITLASLTAANPAQGGGYQFDVTLSSYLNYRVQASGDLVNWSDIGTFLPTTNSYLFSDNRATNKASRFYRVIGP